MSKLLISTQVRENYGAHDWDGKGECPQYWKMKGGNDYVVLNVDPNKASETYLAVVDQCTSENNYFDEYVLDWEIVEDDYLTSFEMDQLEFDGRIQFPCKVLEVA